MDILGGMGSIFRGRQRENKDTPPGPNNSDTPPADARVTEQSGARSKPSGAPATLGELKASGYRPLPIREEMRRNLLTMIKQNRAIFPGIIGYEDTVIPQVENAIISGQDIIFLGERGQAKSRHHPAAGEPARRGGAGRQGLRDQRRPLRPDLPGLPREARRRGRLPWRSPGCRAQDRYGEKLATPDTTIADLIGDVDPIKVAEGRYLSDELTIHYGLIPRTNRGIFCINELPDLTERLQVGLFNLMEERDIQIRGYRIRLPLDIFIVASANPEDYTSRGRIITPLKDRFGSQVRTHYPATIEDEIAIVDQEWRRFSGEGPDFYVPEFMKEIIAEVTHLARKSSDVNQRSGVSVRVSIANQETVVSNAIRRAIRLGEKLAVPRISDLGYIVASTTGKVELESLEDTDEARLVEDLAKKAVLAVFNRYYQIDQLEDVVRQFSNGFSVEVSDDMGSQSYVRDIKEIGGLARAVKRVNASETPEIVASSVEFILEGLHLNKRLNKSAVNGKTVYRR